MNDQILVQAKDLKKFFVVKKGFFSSVRGEAKAVDGIDINIHDGETMALVGESGCGKSTTSRMLLGLMEPTDGKILYLGKDIFENNKTTQKLVSKDLQMIFQDVSASLNPRKTLRQILTQPFLIHKLCGREEFDDRVAELLEMVELKPARNFIDRFPHELSGGQRQRIAIARAIASKPRFIVADEPVSGLDMSVKASILNLIIKTQREMNQSYLLVTHDLAIVRSVAKSVMVMYLGKIVEESPVADLFNNPLHPYTQALLAATPIPNPLVRRKERIRVVGEVPSSMKIPTGCRFHTRCVFAEERCRKEEPVFREVAPGHFVACHLV